MVIFCFSLHAFFGFVLFSIVVDCGADGLVVILLLLLFLLFNEICANLLIVV